MNKLKPRHRTLMAVLGYTSFTIIMSIQSMFLIPTLFLYDLMIFVLIALPVVTCINNTTI